MIGGNDFLRALDGDATVTEAELAAMVSNAETILDALGALQPPPTVVFCTYYDLFDGESQRLSSGFFSAYAGFSEAVLDGNARFRALAQRKGVRLVDLYPLFLKHCYGRDLGDPQVLNPVFVSTPIFPNFDIHPVTAGHVVIHEAVFAMLEQLKATPTPQGPSGWILH